MPILHKNGAARADGVGMFSARARRGGALVAIVIAAGALPAAAGGTPDPPGSGAAKVPGIESRLAGLAREAQRTRSGERVLVQVLDAGGASAAVVRRGGRVVGRSGSLLSVDVPAASLIALAGDPEVVVVFEPAVPHAEGDVVSQGVAFHNADDWHGAGFDGSDVDILVLDTGFEGYPNPELPSVAGVEVGASCPGGALTGGGSHGTGVAEIVRDVAPGANIHLFRTCKTTDATQIVSYVAAHDIEIVSQSLGYFNTGPLDGSDPWGALSFIDGSVAAGAVWFNSAGNYRLGHWAGAWVDDGSGVLDFGPTGYIEMSLDAGDDLYLRWDDWTVDLPDCAGCASTVDLDLHLTDLGGVDVPADWASSDTEQSPQNPNMPVERITVEGSGTYRIEVRYWPSGPIPSGLQIDLFSPAADLPIGYRVTSRSINDPSAFESAIAVGAVHYSDGLHESGYSSEGPTADGRVKPDLSGADCVDSWTYVTFCGTSASAPHAAGLAALILQATGAPPSEVRGLMLGLTHDKGAPGPDNQYGYGVIDLGSAPGGDCGGVAGTIVALPGQIEIRGTSGADVIVGNGENNRIWGFGGSDRICGGRGGDMIRPGSGDDRVKGGRGADRIVYRSGEDILHGNKGDGDLLDFRSQGSPVSVDLKKHAAVVGGTVLTIDGFERVFGGSGDDVISGSDRDEVLKGYAGADDLRGRGGSDRLYGGRGSDRLDGGAGDQDHLDGGRGTDTCINAASYTKCES